MGGAANRELTQAVQALAYEIVSTALQTLQSAVGHSELGQSIELITGKDSSTAGRDVFDQHQMELARTGCKGESLSPNVAMSVGRGDLVGVQGPDPPIPLEDLNGEERMSLSKVTNRL